MRLPLLFTLAIAASTAFAQQATVQGVVTDASGSSVPAAKIVIRNVNTGVQQALESNAQGFYSAPFLVPGAYEVAVTAGGFAPQTRTNLRLDVNMTARVDFTLVVG